MKVKTVIRRIKTMKRFLMQVMEWLRRGVTAIKSDKGIVKR